MSTCNRLDLQALGSQPVMPKNLPDHCLKHYIFRHCLNILLGATSHIRPRDRDRILHFKHFHWWERWSRSQVRFTLMLEGPTEYVCECKMDAKSNGILHGIDWIVFQGHFGCFQKLPLGGRFDTKPGNRGTLNAHNRWFNLLCCVWRPTWIGICWNSNWLRARSQMASHYTWGSVTTLHEWFWRCVGTMACGHLFLGSPNSMVAALGVMCEVFPKAVPTDLSNHVLWSRTFKSSVKPYVTGPSTKCYFNK